MPKRDFQLIIIARLLDGDRFCIAEALFFPEVSRHSDSFDWVRRAASENAIQILESLPLIEIYKRRKAGTTSISDIAVTLDAPRRSTVWRKPVELHLPAVIWQHDETASLAYLPSLGIEVTAKDREATLKLAAKEAHAILLRTKTSASLGKLVWIDRCKSVRVDLVAVSAEILTPKQIEAARGRKKEKSVLSEIGTDLTREILPEAFEIDSTVNRIAEILTGRRPRSILIVGPQGVGKTEMAKALAEFFFRDRNRLIRFDMSEYADPISVMRLTGGVFGSEGLLTSKVREQPFSVPYARRDYAGSFQSISGA